MFYRGNEGFHVIKPFDSSQNIWRIEAIGIGRLENTGDVHREEHLACTFCIDSPP